MAGSGFDQLARPYRWLEYLTFGHSLERCRGAQLGRMREARLALVLGDGDGRFTAALLAANAKVRVVAVDRSPAMLAQLAKRASKSGEAPVRFTLVCGDAVALLEQARVAGTGVLAASTGFDLVATHFFLDCLDTAEVRRLAIAVHALAAPGAEWIVSEFGVPTLWARALVALLYRAFRLLAGLKTQTLPDWEKALNEAGFACTHQVSWLRGLLTSTAWRSSCSAGGAKVSEGVDAELRQPGVQ